MKAVTLAAALSIVTWIFATSSDAQPTEPELEGRPLGDVYLSFSPDSYVEMIEVTQYEFFDWYIIMEIDFTDLGFPPAANENLGFNAWELNVAIPDEIAVTSRMLIPSSSINFANVNLYPNGYETGTGERIYSDETPYVILHCRSMLLTPGADLRIELEGFPGTSSFFPPAPGWLESPSSSQYLPSPECFNWDGTPLSCLRRFQSVRGIVVNPSVPVEASSFGTIKSLYR